MTDAGFTKGPWYVGGNSRDILWFDHALDRCKLVATVAGYVESEGTVPHGLGTARLIAAAPDLFEALKGIVDDDDAGVSLADQRARSDARMAAAKAALLKATGA